MIQENIDTAVKELLSLKAQYKSAAGKDWKPDNHPEAPAPPPGADVENLNIKIKEKGDRIRQLKSQKSSKVCKGSFIATAVADVDISL